MHDPVEPVERLHLYGHDSRPARGRDDRREDGIVRFGGQRGRVGCSGGRRGRQWCRVLGTLTANLELRLDCANVHKGDHQEGPLFYLNFARSRANAYT